MEINEIWPALEAILFTAGDSVEIRRIAKVLGAEPWEVRQAAETLAADYERRSSGLRLVRMEERLQLVTAAEHNDVINRCLEKRPQPRLSPTALEVLSIVAYFQPVTRAYIEQNNNTTVRPEIVGQIDNLADYDTILLGYPIWYGKVPRIILTFLDTYKDELKGKTIIPFCTSMSSGISGSIPELKSALPDSDVKDGFRGTDSTTEKQIEIELKNSGYNK